MTYYLWNTQRQGWVTSQGTTSTNIEEAEPFDTEQAIQRMKAFLGHDHTFGVVPVPADLIAGALR